MTQAPTRTDGIVRQLRDQILAGRYRPGDRLPAERELAQRLAVNRTSVREALKKLEQLGLVAIRRGGGATVRRLEEASVEIVPHLLRIGGRTDPALVVQVLDVHEMLVAGGARLAVERGSEDELLHARELLARLAAPDLDDAERIELINAIFELITQASGNLVLRLARNAIAPIIGGALGRGLWRALRPPAEAHAAQVRSLDAAIAARDPISTEEAVRALLRDRRARLVALLEDPEFRIAPEETGEVTAHVA